MWKKIKAYILLILFVIHSKINFLKFKIQTGHLFVRYEKDEKAQRMLEYCAKVIENENYTYSNYEEKLFYNTIKELAEENNCSLKRVALTSISLIIGAF